MYWKTALSALALFVILHASPANILAAHYNFFLEINGYGLAENEEEIFALVNRERSRVRLAELDWDNRLAKLARSYSRQMAREHFFDHYDRAGLSVIDRANNSRIRGWRKIGENLFMSYGVPSFSDAAVRGWMRSPSHRRNMLDRSWTATGIGIAESRDGTIYVTQVFIQD